VAFGRRDFRAAVKITAELTCNSVTAAAFTPALSSANVRGRFHRRTSTAPSQPAEVPNPT